MDLMLCFNSKKNKKPPTAWYVAKVQKNEVVLKPLQ